MSQAEIKKNKFELNKAPSLSNKFKFWLEREIDFILEKYFQDQTNLSCIHWPKSLRPFLKYIFEYLRDEATPEVLCELIAESSLDSLISDFNQPTTFHIPIRVKKQVGDILSRIHVRKCNLVIKKPLSTSTFNEVIWPHDIIDIMDLNEYPASDNLRCDVKGYIWNMIMSNFPNSRFILSYDKSYTFPIQIKVEPAFIAAFRSLFDQHSKINHATCELLPNDIIEIVILENIKSIEVHDESLTSGSGWNSGTIGRIL